MPLAQPPPIMSVSLWLKDKLVMGEGDYKEISGAFGLLMSQTYECVFILSGVCWKRGMAYETANLWGPSECQDTSLTLLLQISGGSLPLKRRTWRAWGSWWRYFRRRDQILHWQNTPKTYRFDCSSAWFFRRSHKELSLAARILDLCPLSSWNEHIAGAQWGPQCQASLPTYATFPCLQYSLSSCWPGGLTVRWCCQALRNWGSSARSLLAWGGLERWDKRQFRQVEYLRRLEVFRIHALLACIGKIRPLFI